MFRININVIMACGLYVCLLLLPACNGEESNPDAGSDTPIVEDCTSNLLLCQTCSEGAIAESCQCGSNVQTDGFCCRGNHQGAMCNPPPQMCPEGVITENCQCGTNAQTEGFCCSGTHQDVMCNQQAQPLAFPGVEGFGAYVSGGRGGQVIKVTTLQATGPGSFDEALRTVGPRIVVFEVSGVINGDFDITEPDITIAGQTAPGAGITIVGRLWAPFAEIDGSSRVQNIIIRHLRIRHICRPGIPDNQCDTMRLSSQSRFVLDHVSLAWGIDETLDMWGGSHDWTIQDSTFEHPCLNSSNSPNHAYGMLNRRGGRGSVLRTAMLNCRDRNPALADGPFDIINMLVYNHQTGLTHHNPATGAFNVIGNYYRKGPAGGIGKPFWLGGSQTSNTEPSFWFFDNYLDDVAINPFGRFDDPWLASHGLLGENGMGSLPVSHRASVRHDYSSYSEWVAPTVLSSGDTFDHVLQTAGAFPRDIVTRTAITEARDRTGAFGCSIRQQLDDQGNASGSHPLMDGLTPTTPPVDTDDDGMADVWELTHGLNPGDASDNSRVMTNGYTAIENYINELAELLIP